MWSFLNLVRRQPGMIIKLWKERGRPETHEWDDGLLAACTILNDLFLNFIFGLDYQKKMVDSCELKLKLHNSLTFSGFLSWSFDFIIIQDALLNKMTRNLADIQVKDLGVKEQLRWVYRYLGFLEKNLLLFSVSPV